VSSDTPEEQLEIFSLRYVFKELFVTKLLEWRQRQVVAYMTDKGNIQTQDERMKLLLNIVQRLFYDSEENSVRMADIIREAEIHEIEQKETEEILEQLRRYGLINKLPNGTFKI
jgi:DNA replicative helicase MCM subunit Mcm2 (Cdc46/Mcm family)